MRFPVHIAAIAALLLAASARAAPAAAPTKPGPGTAAPQAAPPDAAAQEKAAEEIRTAFARELDALQKFSFEAPDGIKGSVEARGAPQVKAEGPEIVIPLGTQQPVTCTVVPQRLDAGASTRNMVNTVAKALKLLAVRPVAVQAVAGSALVFSEIVYQAPTEKGPMIGQLKLAVYAHDGHSLLCHHDEPGYAKTFQRVVASIAASIEGGGEDERTGARYAEIAVMRIADMPIGYSEMVIWDRKGGGRVAAEYETQIAPRSQTDIVAIDGYRQEASDDAGLLLSGTYVHVTNGELDSRIELSRGKAPRTFRYKGEKQGKKLTGTFRTKAGLATDLWFSRRFDAKAGYGPAAEVKHEGYSFAANPVGPIVIACRKDSTQERRAEMAVGPLRLGGELDENGFFARAELPVGPTKLVVERLWSRGAP